MLRSILTRSSIGGTAPSSLLVSKSSLAVASKYSRPLRPHTNVVAFSTFSFMLKESDKNSDKKANGDEFLPSKKTDDASVQEFSVKSKSSPAAPAPIDSTNLEPLLKKDNKPYIPRLKHERLTYEYPGLPNQDEFNKYNEPAKSNHSRWKRHLPKVAIFFVTLWAGYSIKVWVYEPESGTTSNDMLSPEEFHPFVITHKEMIDDQHYLVEIKPKNDHWEYSYANSYAAKSIWNGSKGMWSIEVKHPQIMVVRSYTPLPLYFLKSELTRSGQRKPLLKVINNDEEDCDKHGTMVLYIKRYDDGEVSKFITNKEVGDEIEVRGPDTDYKFPYHPIRDFKSFTRPTFRDLPSTMEMDKSKERNGEARDIPEVDNLTFYAAGTGIAPILQVLMSRKPYEGFVDLHYSAVKPGELKPLERFIFFLEKLDRIRFTAHYDIHQTRLSEKDFKKPVPPKYLSELRKLESGDANKEEDDLKLRFSILDDKSDEVDEKSKAIDYPRFSNALEQAIVTSKEPKSDSALAVVCGPDGFVEYVAGPRNDVDKEQGEVKGLLGKKGWDKTNVYKLG